MNCLGLQPEDKNIKHIWALAHFYFSALAKI
jgi:hypothetical protein